MGRVPSVDHRAPVRRPLLHDIATSPSEGDRCEACGAGTLDRAVSSRERPSLLECPSCGVWIRPGADATTPSPEAPSPAEFRDGPTRRCWSRRLDLLRDLHGGRLLDLRCGDGVFLELARSRGFQVLGVEPCRYTSARTAQWLNAPVYCGDLPELDLPPGSVDVVTAWGALDCTRRPGAYLRAIRSVLGAGGSAVLAVANRRRKIATPERLDRAVFWDARSIERALGAHGMDLVAVRPDPAAASGFRRIPEAVARLWSLTGGALRSRGLVAIASVREPGP